MASIADLIDRARVHVRSLTFKLISSVSPSDAVVYKKDRIVRVVTRFKNSPNFSAGTGFFISKEGTLLTCFHVAFGSDADAIKNSPVFKAAAGTDQEKFTQYFETIVASLQAVFPSGASTQLRLVKFDSHHDVAVLAAADALEHVKPFVLDFDCKPIHGSQVTFAGFPTAVGYSPDNSPFAFNTGVVSSFPESKVAGGRYEHIQINAVNLGGNSGGPLFLKGSNKVIGIVNGNMNWGADNIGYVNNGQVQPGPFRIPLSIAYATSLKLLRTNKVL